MVARDCGYAVGVFDMFDFIYCGEQTNEDKISYLNLCLENNLKREKKVPESVIYQMFLQEYGNENLLGDCVAVDID